MPSRNEDILQSIIDDTPYGKPGQSRIENLLIELKEVIEEDKTEISQRLSQIVDIEQGGEE